MSNAINYVKRFWSLLIGDSKQISLESKVFHTFSIIAFLACIFEFIVNLSLNFYGSAIICVAILVIHSFVFLLSRKWDKWTFAIFLTGIECNVFLGIDYFLNGGLDGPIMLLFVSTLFLMSSISQTKQIKTWVVLNLITAVSVGIIEYRFPNTIVNSYTTRADRFLDNLSTYILCAILLSSGLYYIKKSYSFKNRRLKENTDLLSNMNAEKDKLFSIIAHDLKSPLNAVKQYLEFLNHGTLTIEERKFIEQQLLITTSGTQNLLSNLLEWSRNQIEGKPITLEYLNLYEILKTTIENTNLLCSNKSILLIVDIHTEVVCFANKHMIQMVVRNLLNNAIKFTPKEGLIHIGTSVDGKKCTLYIKDNGVGIPEEKIDKVFSLDIKSSAGTENETGTGLGLVLCKEYVDKMGGNITFESEQNKGTTFYVTLLCKKLA